MSSRAAWAARRSASSSPSESGRIIILPALKAPPAGDKRYAASDELQAGIRRALGVQAQGREPPWVQAMPAPDGLAERAEAVRGAREAAEVSQAALEAAEADYEALARFQRLLWQEGAIGLDGVVVEALRLLGFEVQDRDPRERELKSDEGAALFEIEASEHPIDMAAHHRLRQRIERAIEKRGHAPRGVLFVNGQRLQPPSQREHVSESLRLGGGDDALLPGADAGLYEAVVAKLNGDDESVARVPAAPRSDRRPALVDCCRLNASFAREGRARMSSKWALILGASSGFGGATSIELARHGYGIFGVHFDLRSTLPNAVAVQDAVKAAGQDAVFFNINAADDVKRADALDAVRETVGDGRPRAGADALARLRDAAAVHRRQPEGADQPEADGHDARRDGAQPRVLGAGHGRPQAARQGQPHLRDDEQRLDARDQGVRRRLGGEGGAGVAHPAARVRAGAAGRDGERDPRRRHRHAGAAPHPRRAGAARSGRWPANPSGRSTTPEDVAKAIAVLSDERLYWMTGNVIGVDGGEELSA